MPDRTAAVIKARGVVSLSVNVFLQIDYELEFNAILTFHYVLMCC